MADSGFNRHADVTHASATIIRNIEQAQLSAAALESRCNLAPKSALKTQLSSLIGDLSSAADSITQSLTSYVAQQSSISQNTEETAKKALFTIADDVGHVIIKRLQHSLGSASANGAKSSFSVDFKTLQQALAETVQDTSLVFDWMLQVSGSSQGQPLPPFPESVIARMSKYDAPKHFEQFMTLPIASRERAWVEECATIVVPTRAPPNKLSKQPASRAPSSERRFSGFFRRSSSNTPSPDEKKFSTFRRHSTLATLPVSATSRPGSRAGPSPVRGQSGEPGPVTRQGGSGATAPPATTSSSSLASTSDSFRSESGPNTTVASSPATSLSSVSLTGHSCDTQEDTHQIDSPTSQVDSKLGLTDEEDNSSKTGQEIENASTPPLQAVLSLPKPAAVKPELRQQDHYSPGRPISNITSGTAEDPETSLVLSSTQPSPEASRFPGSPRTPTSPTKVTLRQSLTAPKPAGKKPWMETRSLKQAGLLHAGSEDSPTALTPRMPPNYRSSSTGTITRLSRNVPPALLVSSPLAGSNGSAKFLEAKDRTMSGTSLNAKRCHVERGRLCPGSLKAQATPLLTSGTIIAIPVPLESVALPVSPSVSTISSRRNSIESCATTSGKRKWLSSLFRRSSRTPRRSSSMAPSPTPLPEPTPPEEAAWKCNTCPCVIPLGESVPSSAVNGEVISLEAQKIVTNSLAKIQKVTLPLEKTDPTAARVLGNNVEVSWRWPFLAKSHASYLETTAEVADDLEHAAKAGPYICVFCSNSSTLARSLGSHGPPPVQASYAHSLPGSNESTATLPAGQGSTSCASTSGITASAPPPGITLTPSSSSQALSLSRQLHLQNMRRMTKAGYQKPGSGPGRAKTSFTVYHDPKSLFEHIVTTHAYDAQIDKMTRNLLGNVARQTNCAVIVGHAADARDTHWDLNIVW